MANMTYKGTDEIISVLENLSLVAERRVIADAMYEGAGVIADEIRAQIDLLHEDNGKGSSDKPLYGVGSMQKKALKESLGISSIKTDSNFVYHMYIGFAGYNSGKTKRWPQGQPNQMIARAVNKGTSFMKKQPFLRRAVAAGQKKAEEIMTSRITGEVERIVKGVK